jgi:hypothetical protein
MNGLTNALYHTNKTPTALGIEHDLKFASLGKIPPSLPPAIPHVTSSLTHFATIENPSIPLSVLLGWCLEAAPALSDVLPASLVHLHFERMFGDNSNTNQNPILLLRHCDL